MHHTLLILAGASALALAACQSDPRSTVATGGDPGVATAMRCMPMVGETPFSVPGATVISAAEVAALKDDPRRPVLIDVATGTRRQTVPGAVWLPGAGACDREAPDMQRTFEDRVAALTGDDKTRPVVVFCPNRNCWLSYNGAIRLARAGYRDVRWFRDGTEGWRLSGRTLAPVEPGWTVVQASR
jgi:PQQ-dependent catabolism-associated CXXCW motif protein